MKILLLLASLCILACSQYAVVDKDVGSTYLRLTLKYTGQDDYYVKPKSKVVKELVFLFKALTYSDFTFKIYDPVIPRPEVPQGGIFPQDPQANFTFPLALAAYNISYTTEHFHFLVARKATGAVLFDSSVVALEFSDYYIQFGTITDSKTLFGFSERFTEHFQLQPGTWTVWNKDNGQKIDKGDVDTGGIQTHGYYPVYLSRERSGDYHIGYFRTSSALDVEVESFSNTSYLKIYRTIGGIIDFRFFLGEKDPEQVVTAFHTFVGKALIPPFWSLGFHQCRWGYHNVSALETVLSKYEQNDIPLDTIWSDIDYMHDF
jgi:alpha-glucosidase